MIQAMVQSHSPHYLPAIFLLTWLYGRELHHEESNQFHVFSQMGEVPSPELPCTPLH